MSKIEEWRAERAQLRAENEKRFHSHAVPLDMPDVQADMDVPVTEANLQAKASVLMRIGQLDLESGTGSFHVTTMMKQMGAALGVYVRPSAMLRSLEASFSDGTERTTHIVESPTVTVSTRRVWFMEHLCDWLLTSIGQERAYYAAPVSQFSGHIPDQPSPTIPTVREVHAMLDTVEYAAKPYTFAQHGIAAAIACACFAFLLGGGLYDVIAAFLGAFAGQWLRSFMTRRHYSQYATTGFAVTLAGFVSIGALRIISVADPTALSHDTAYIGAMLFALPSFPLITGGLDISKLDYLSAVQRWAHAAAVMVVATMAAWVVAAVVNLAPEAFPEPTMNLWLLTPARLVASFVGVVFFSRLVNSPPRMALVAGVIGGVANTVRLTLVDADITPAAAAFVAAFLVGLLAEAWKRVSHGRIRRGYGFPRHTVAIPSVVIMVPGFYMYQAMYNLGSLHFDVAMDWIFRALLVAIALPIGLALARFMTDREWRYEV